VADRIRLVGNPTGPLIVSMKGIMNLDFGAEDYIVYHLLDVPFQAFYKFQFYEHLS